MKFPSLLFMKNYITGRWPDIIHVLESLLGGK